MGFSPERCYSKVCKHLKKEHGAVTRESTSLCMSSLPAVLSDKHDFIRVNMLAESTRLSLGDWVHLNIFSSLSASQNSRAVVSFQFHSAYPFQKLLEMHAGGLNCPIKTFHNMHTTPLEHPAMEYAMEYEYLSKNHYLLKVPGDLQPWQPHKHPFEAIAQDL